MAETAALSGDVDVLILGAGPVGLTLARMLAGSRLKVALVDRRGLSAQAADPRALALSHGSRQLLEPLGAWPGGKATIIESIHISQRNGFGRSLMQAGDYGLPALGYVTRYGDLTAALTASLPATTPVENCDIVSLQAQPDGVVVELRTTDGDSLCNARLVVHAEGTPSDCAEVSTRDYRQQALIAEVRCAEGHRRRAWERFTPDGPLALLPLEQGYALVFTVPPEKAARLLTLDDHNFLAALQDQFGQRLHFTDCGPRSAFPLALRWRRWITAPRQVWIGNAAQSLHPVSGQGFNLGLRDAWQLAECLLANACDPGLAIAGYAARRRLDRIGGTAFTDGIVRIFSNDFVPLKLARGFGLAALDLFPPARHFVAKRMLWGARAWP